MDIQVCCIGRPQKYSLMESRRIIIAGEGRSASKTRKSIFQTSLFFFCFYFLHGRSPSFSPIPICLYSNKYLIFAIKLTKIHFISSYYSNINSHTWALITESWDIGYGVFWVNNLLARQTMWEKSTFLVENLQGLCFGI